MTKFKQGDVVKIVGASITGALNHLDKQVVVSHYDGDHYWLDIPAPGKIYPESSLQLVKEEKVVKNFKVGDKVRVIGPSVSNRTGSIGDETVITHYNKLTDSYWTGLRKDGHIFKESSLELIEEEDTMEVTRENLNKHTIYVLTEDSAFFTKNEEIRLWQDDGTSIPKFKSLWDGHVEFAAISHLAVLGHEPKPEVKELTLQDVADKFGVDVEQIRIKE